jgi:hypothetical protein
MGWLESCYSHPFSPASGAIILTWDPGLQSCCLGEGRAEASAIDDLWEPPRNSVSGGEAACQGVGIGVDVGEGVAPGVAVPAGVGLTIGVGVGVASSLPLGSFL